MGKDNKQQNNAETTSVVTRETVGLTLGVFSILIMIILFTGSLIFGDLGASICSFLFGMFGFFSYFVFPCVLFASVALVTGKNPIRIKGFVLFFCLTLLFVGVLAQAIATSGEEYTEGSYGSYLSKCFSAGKNGVRGCTPFGFVGGLLAYPFIALATGAGAIVIFVVASGLCLYLTVNSVLLFKGIRLGLSGRMQKGNEATEGETNHRAQAESVARPANFSSLDNTRTVGKVASEADERPGYMFNEGRKTLPQNGYRRPSVEYTPVQVPPLQPERQQSVAPTYAQSQPISPLPQQGDFTKNDYGQKQNFNSNYDILYGNDNPTEYRNKNLIFDSSSRFNSRIQNNSLNDSSEQKTEYPNYSQFSSRELDRNVQQSPKTKEVIYPDTARNENPGHGYSVYKTEVFGRESEKEERNAPNQPSYRAPDPFLSGTASRKSEGNVFPARASSYGDISSQESVNESSNRSDESLTFFPQSEERNLRRREETYFSGERDPFGRNSENPEEISYGESHTEETKQESPFIGSSRGYEPENTLRGVNCQAERAGDFSNLFDDDTEEEREPEESSVPDLGMARDGRSSERGVRREGEAMSRADFSVRSERNVPEYSEAISASEEVVAPQEDRGGDLNVPVPAEPEKEVVKPRVFKDYVHPPVDLFDEYNDTASVDYNEIERNKLDIVETLAAFKIDIQITNVQVGPTFTRYDFTFPKNVNANSISKYSNNIALALKVAGKVNICTNFANGTMAIEVPNKKRPIVGFRSLLDADSYVNAKPGALQICIGKNVDGKTATASLAKMTHLLVAGTTGSGKSVFLHEIIMSLIMKYSPEEVRLILIDPKQVEFSLYDNLPHLMINEILSDPNKIVVMLNWAINEMERRYTLFRYGGVRNIDEFNAATKNREEKLPKIVIIADEVADIMAVAKKDVEDRISRLAAKARAAGIHLVLATQRPTVEVITGTLKANLPSRFALRVSEELNSRIVLDESGAENLLGNGDLLYKWGSMFNAERVQAPFIDTTEIQRVCDFIKENNESYFDQTAADFINSGGKQATTAHDGQEGDGEGEIEPVYIDALRFVVRSGSASISMIQRKCSVGYNKAGKIIEWMELNKYISEFDGAKSRKVLLTAEEFVEKFGEL